MEPQSTSGPAETDSGSTMGNLSSLKDLDAKTLEALAQEIYKLMREELRVERERLGGSPRKF
ncbi:MAG: hypothetical protein H0T73_09670 [Ardenticatenales bacterium]|nr:hypothetical protein [Ardenticatenales bacterium]